MLAAAKELPADLLVMGAYGENALSAIFGLGRATRKVVCEAHERDNLERLCRYVARGPIALDRLFMDGDGLVVNELKRPFSNGTTHVLFEPLDFMARLAALVPRPRVHLVRYHGLFAPNAKHRHRVVKHTPGTTGSDDNLECSHDSQPTPSSASMMLDAKTSKSLPHRHQPMSTVWGKGSRHWRYNRTDTDSPTP